MPWGLRLSKVLFVFSLVGNKMRLSGFGGWGHGAAVATLIPVFTGKTIFGDNFYVNTQVRLLYKSNVENVVCPKNHEKKKCNILVIPLLNFQNLNHYYV